MNCVHDMMPNTCAICLGTDKDIDYDTLSFTNLARSATNPSRGGPGKNDRYSGVYNRESDQTLAGRVRRVSFFSL